MIKHTITVEFPDEAAELLDNPDGVCLVVPLTVAETVHLGKVLDGVGKHLGFILKCMRMLKELTETKPESIKHISETLDKMIEPTASADEIFDSVRILLGRAITSKNGTKKKGRMQ
jgi:hypothetical protein